MQIELVKLTTGDVAIVVNGQMVLEADPSFESTSSVGEAAQRLATALDTPLVIIESAPPPMEDWNWDDVLETLPSANGRTAAQVDRPSSDAAR